MIKKKALGPEHADVAASLQNLVQPNIAWLTATIRHTAQTLGASIAEAIPAGPVESSGTPMVAARPVRSVSSTAFGHLCRTGARILPDTMCGY